MNNTVALDRHAEATEHRPISPIEHDHVAAAAAAHDALAIGEPLLIVAGGTAAARTELCRALTADRLGVGEDVLVLATSTNGAFPETALAAYLGLPADGPAAAPPGAPDDALPQALAQYATAETRLVLMLTHAERLDEGGVAAIRRLRQADPAARALSLVLLGDDMVGLVGDRLLRPAPPRGLRFIRLTPLALAPAAPVAALPAGPPTAPTVLALPTMAPPVLAPCVIGPPVTAQPVSWPSVTASAAPSVASWAADGLTQALAEPATLPHDHAAPWHAAADPAPLASGPADVGMAHEQGVYDEAADGAADLAPQDEPADAFESPEGERTVPYWESLPPRVPTPEPETAAAPSSHVPSPRDWHSYQDPPHPAARAGHASVPAEPDYAAHAVAPEPPPASASETREARGDKDWRSLRAAAQTGRHPPADDDAASAYAPAEAASYQDAFAQLAAQEARAVEPPRAVPQAMLRRAQVFAGGSVGDAVDEDGVPLETRSRRPRMILPIAGMAVAAALVGWFVVRTVVGAGHPAPPSVQTALSTTAAKDAPPAAPPPLPSDATAAAGKAEAAGVPGQTGTAPPGAVPPTAGETAAAPGAAREAAAEHARVPAPAAAPAIAEAAVPAAHPPAAPVTADAPHPAPQHPAPEQQAAALPLPPPPTVVQAPMAAPALPPSPGLLVIAKAEDTLQSLYSRVYKGLQPPPFEVVEAMNPHEIKLGDVVVFPAPPGGWHRLPNTAGR